MSAEDETRGAPESAAPVHGARCRGGGSTQCVLRIDLARSRIRASASRGDADSGICLLPLVGWYPSSEIQNLPESSGAMSSTTRLRPAAWRPFTTDVSSVRSASRAR